MLCITGSKKAQILSRCIPSSGTFMYIKIHTAKLRKTLQRIFNTDIMKLSLDLEEEKELGMQLG